MEQSIEAAARNGLSFNPHIAALPPYNAGMNVALARALSGRDDIARLASNENPDGCSPTVMAALASPSFEPWRYADPACSALRAALGARLAVAPERIVVGNGSEEMIAAVSRAMFPMRPSSPWCRASACTRSNRWPPARRLSRFP